MFEIFYEVRLRLNYAFQLDLIKKLQFLQGTFHDVILRSDLSLYPHFYSLSVFLSLSLYFSLSLSHSLYPSPSFFLPFCLSLLLPISVFHSFFTYLFLSHCPALSLSLSVCLSLSLSLSLFFFLSPPLSLYLSLTTCKCCNF